MMENWNLIDRQLLIILDKLRGRSIFGMEINEDDAAMLIVAAYCLGCAEKQKEDCVMECAAGTLK